MIIIINRFTISFLPIRLIVLQSNQKIDEELQQLWNKDMQ